MSPADGKVADLNKPLLGHGWSAAFSFAKCHLEENAPYDTFSQYAMSVEQFSRFARFWTRGYVILSPRNTGIPSDRVSLTHDFVAMIKDTMFTRRHATLCSTITESKPMAMATVNGSSTSVIVFAKHRSFGLKLFCRYRGESQMQTTGQILDFTVWASAVA